MKQLIYLDSNSVESFHEGFNSSSLLMFSCFFDKVFYYSSNSSKKATLNILRDLPSNVFHSPIIVLKTKSALTSFFHSIVASIINIFFVLKARESILYINYNNLWEVPFINCVLKVINRKVVIACHGEMEYLVNGKKLNMLSNRVLKWMKSDKTKISRGLFFCVLGASIYNNVRNTLPPNISSHFISFDLTLVDSRAEKRIGAGEIRKIGVIGTAHENKGLKELLAFGDIIKQLQRYEFYTLGRVLCDVDLLRTRGIRFIDGADKGFVKRDVLISYIQLMDVIVFLHSKDSYKFTASGALMDAIDFEKPVLSLHNDYFDYIYSKACYGKLFNNIESMFEELTQEDVAKMPIDYEKNKLILSPITASKECERIFESIGFL